MAPSGRWYAVAAVPMSMPASTASISVRTLIRCAERRIDGNAPDPEAAKPLGEREFRSDGRRVRESTAPVNRAERHAERRECPYGRCDRKCSHLSCLELAE